MASGSGAFMFYVGALKPAPMGAWCAITTLCRFTDTRVVVFLLLGLQHFILLRHDALIQQFNRIIVLQQLYIMSSDQICSHF